MGKHSVRSWRKSHTLRPLIIKSFINISLGNEINLSHTIILPKTQFHKNPKAQLPHTTENQILQPRTARDTTSVEKRRSHRLTKCRKTYKE